MNGSGIFTGNLGYNLQLQYYLQTQRGTFSELSNIPLDRRGIWDIVLGMERKAISFRDLGHSFATHLLESRVDLRYIQELLGHKSSRTTEVHTYVTRRDLARIRSPLDRLMEGKS